MIKKFTIYLLCMLAIVQVSNGQFSVINGLANTITISGLPDNSCSGNIGYLHISGAGHDLESYKNYVAQALSEIPISDRIVLQAGVEHPFTFDYQSTNIFFEFRLAPFAGGSTSFYFFKTISGIDGIVNTDDNGFIGHVDYPTSQQFTGHITQLKLGSRDGYIVIPYTEEAVANPNGIVYNALIIPFVVEGVVDDEVPILGTTVEPQMPYLVLHAPPGDASSSQFVKERSFCRSMQTTYASDNSFSANAAVKLGVAGSAGFILTTDFEFSVTLKAGVGVSDMLLESTQNETCVTINETFMTSELVDNEGGGDVFVGYGTDLEYGIYDFIEMDYDLCDAQEKTGLIYKHTGTPREFFYTKSKIESEIQRNKEIIADTTLNVKIRNEAENQMNVWGQVLQLNSDNIANAQEKLSSVSFSGKGGSKSSSESIKTTTTSTIDYEMYLEASIGVETVVEVGGSGFSGGFEYKAGKRMGESTSQSTTETEMISYTLKDNSEGDEFAVDIYRDEMFGTPIFKVIDGSKTSCPYQGGYQRDQPALYLDATTERHLEIDNVGATSSASIKLDVCNDSNDDRTYNLLLSAGSNVNGAIVTAAGPILNGNDQGQAFTVPANDCIEDLIIEIRRQSDVSPYDFDSIEVYLAPLCQPEIRSAVTMSVQFNQPTSTDDFADVESIKVYPNPTKNMLYVDCDDLKSDLDGYRLYDTRGQIIKSSNEVVNNGPIEIDVQDLEAGLYWIQVQSGSTTTSKRVMIMD